MSFIYHKRVNFSEMEKRKIAGPDLIFMRFCSWLGSGRGGGGRWMGLLEVVLAGQGGGCDSHFQVVGPDSP